MALKFRIPGKFSNPSGLVVRRDDPILPATGALVLTDMSMAAATGIPTSLGNVAAAKAATVLGTTADSLVLPASVKGTNPAGKYLLERTPKGGIHGAFSNTMQPYPQAGYSIDLPAAVKAHIFANPGHKIYYSLWARPTRAGSQQSGGLLVGQDGTNYHTYIYSGGVNPTTDRVANPAINMNDATKVGQPFMLTNAPAAMVGAPTLSNSLAHVKFGNVGTFDSVWSPLSWVFYRLYVEDLTISGRTAATVQAIDTAEWTAAFATGGRFAGDTNTSPTTLT